MGRLSVGEYRAFTKAFKALRHKHALARATKTCEMPGADTQLMEANRDECDAVVTWAKTIVRFKRSIDECERGDVDCVIANLSDVADTTDEAIATAQDANAEFARRKLPRSCAPALRTSKAVFEDVRGLGAGVQRLMDGLDAGDRAVILAGVQRLRGVADRMKRWESNDHLKRCPHARS